MIVCIANLEAFVQKWRHEPANYGKSKPTPESIQLVTSLREAAFRLSEVFREDSYCKAFGAPPEQHVPACEDFEKSLINMVEVARVIGEFSAALLLECGLCLANCEFQLDSLRNQTCSRQVSIMFNFQTLNPKPQPQTPNPEPQTPHLAPHTLHPKP